MSNWRDYLDSETVDEHVEHKNPKLKPTPKLAGEKKRKKPWRSKRVEDVE